MVLNRGITFLLLVTGMLVACTSTSSQPQHPTATNNVAGSTQARTATNDLFFADFDGYVRDADYLAIAILSEVQQMILADDNDVTLKFELDTPLAHSGKIVPDARATSRLNEGVFWSSSDGEQIFIEDLSNLVGDRFLILADFDMYRENALFNDRKPIDRAFDIGAAIFLIHDGGLYSPPGLNAPAQLDEIYQYINN